MQMNKANGIDGKKCPSHVHVDINGDEKVNYFIYFHVIGQKYISKGLCFYLYDFVIFFRLFI